MRWCLALYVEVHTIETIAHFSLLLESRFPYVWSSIIALLQIFFPLTTFQGGEALENLSAMLFVTLLK